MQSNYRPQFEAAAKSNGWEVRLWKFFVPFEKTNKRVVIVDRVKNFEFQQASASNSNKPDSS